MDRLSATKYNRRPKSTTRRECVYTSLNRFFYYIILGMVGEATVMSNQSGNQNVSFHWFLIYAFDSFCNMAFSSPLPFKFVCDPCETLWSQVINKKHFNIKSKGIKDLVERQCMALKLHYNCQNPSTSAYSCSLSPRWLPRQLN